MSVLSVPGFTAEASLYTARGRNTGGSRRETPDEQRGEQGGGDVIPQIAGPNAPGRAGCLSDCRDQHPSWTRARCERACSDPGGTPGSGGGRPRDPSADAVCWTGYAICRAVGFGVFRPDLWASCLFGGPCTCEAIRDDCLSH